MLDDAARELIISGAYGHLATIDADGRPHVTLAWFDVDGDELLFATLFEQRKIRNIRRDPRVTVSFSSQELNEHGLRPYVVVRGVARITEGGAPETLQRLAYRYIGPDAVFPPMPDPPAGFVTRIAVESVSGVGPWAH